MFKLVPSCTIDIKNNVTNDFYRFDELFDISYGNPIDSENFHLIEIYAPTLGICYSVQFKQVLSRSYISEF